ncbi:MAG: prephenate dehydrogenase/arogenate dehydrogenase family protein [Candidatus Pelagibacter sp. TMED106]|jgi:cyclohexadieny/prephenate dehydrogenase|nr:MAG: prephenate dehydrogenase/arogenate dehydrogenase family protein [Candidatus Pelagibacter sp. TMED106]|tara:strand:- start:336 stop:1232 length:897 start_codon:yes stop_codon:yes gene_type:complete
MKNILIIGCGLIGSSLLRAINNKRIAKKIFVFEKSKKNIIKIKKLKLKCKIINNFKNTIPKLDLIIFCTPTSEYEKIISKINKYLSPKTIITDVGSSKKKIFTIINKKLKKGVYWTSSHPIAGSEVSGPENGTKNLFFKKWCILIKEKNTNWKHIFILKQFWSKIGSKVSIMSAKKHDEIFSMTSHLPHLIAYNLVKTATDFEKQKKYDLIKYSAGGLRDFSRIAASNEIMWRDIFFDNKFNILKTIDLFIKNLRSFRINIKSQNNELLIKKLIQTKKVRKKIIQLKQDIDKPDFGRS